LKGILAIVKDRTHVTKVPPMPSATSVIVVFCLAISSLSIAPGQSIQAVSPAAHTAGPAESLYQQLGSVGLDPSRVFNVRGATLDRAAIHITLEDGTIAFTKDVLGRITGAFFEGYGEVLLTPPNEVERRSMSLFTGMAILEERFSTAYFRFNDNSFAELQPGLRAPEQPEEFAARWEPTARNLAQADAMRLLATFSELLPLADGTVSPSARELDPHDRMLHIRVQGDKLGVFDLYYDSTAGEQVGAGQIKTADDGTVYYDVWTSFSTQDTRRAWISQKEISPTLPTETESRENPVLVRSYVIDAHVKPPKELHAEATLQLDVSRGGSRFLGFELSHFLEIESVEADGQAVEFIHNPPVEGTRLARSSNDQVAVILPRPAHQGQRISLHFEYGGEVLAEAGRGLLNVGERGTWYPNRGLAMADFDLTFHYPAEWTLLATGKPAPPAATSSAATSSNEKISRWISERAIPVAGFNLGKYVRAAAQAGNVTVETYATSGVERDFPTSASRTPSLLVVSPDPSPARNAAAVSETAAEAIRYYALRFGPFPYSQLELTQLPGNVSQGWPGLVFLSSYAFLTRDQEVALHMSAVDAIRNQIIPAHETAHQWWGDLVTWSTYRDQWFSEGLANYCALMMLQEKNQAAFRLIMKKYQEDLVSKSEDKDKSDTLAKDAGPVTLGSRLLSSHYPGGYEAISYGRGTWLFHMLRSMMLDASADKGKEADRGVVEEPFVRSLRKVRERYEGKAITTRELLQVFAEDLPPSLRYEGKASLDWFLQGWVNGTSLPRFELRNVKFSAKAKGVVVTGVIHEESAPSTLITSVPVYAVVSGRTPTLLGRVFADEKETAFHFSAPSGTRKLLLDPNETVLTAPK